MLNPRIELTEEKRLLGKRTRMSLANNLTAELWRNFMPLRKIINNESGTELYSAEVYDSSYFEAFNPTREFEKWAAVAVNSYKDQDTGFEQLLVPKGLYVVFIFKGMAKDAAPFFTKIFREWLPQSGYRVDARPHLAVMGEKYKNNDPDSEEEIWIPIKK